jgi:hypothetical protein
VKSALDTDPDKSANGQSDDGADQRSDRAEQDGAAGDGSADGRAYVAERDATDCGAEDSAYLAAPARPHAAAEPCAQIPANRAGNDDDCADDGQTAGRSKEQARKIGKRAGCQRQPQQAAEYAQHDDRQRTDNERPLQGSAARPWSRRRPLRRTRQMPSAPRSRRSQASVNRLYSSGEACSSTARRLTTLPMRTRADRLAPTPAPPSTPARTRRSPLAPAYEAAR